MNNATNTNIFPYLERLLEGEAVKWKTLGEVCDIVKAASKLKSGDYCVSGKALNISQDILTKSLLQSPKMNTLFLATTLKQSNSLILNLFKVQMDLKFYTPKRL